MSDTFTSELKQRPLRRLRVSGRVSGAWLMGTVLLALLTWALVHAARRDVDTGDVGDGDLPRPEYPVGRLSAAHEGDERQDDSVRLTAPRPTKIAPVRSTAALLRAQFEQADDLYQFAQSIGARVSAGEPEAIWILTRVYDYCAGFAAAPVGYASDTRAIGRMDLPTASAMVAARTRVGQRCARFVPEDNLTVQTILVKRTEAAKAGNLPAEASLLASGQPLQDSEEYVRDLVSRVRRSKDPEAYSALSPGMGIAASGRRSIAGNVSGTPFSEIAWQLAACKLGMDCGAGSALMTSYCANGGICSRDPHQDFSGFVYDAAIPRQGTDMVNEMVDSLVSDERMPQ